MAEAETRRSVGGSVGEDEVEGRTLEGQHDLLPSPKHMARIRHVMGEREEAKGHVGLEQGRLVLAVALALAQSLEDEAMGSLHLRFRLKTLADAEARRRHQGSAPRPGRV
jgi:hypothetical protein